MSEAIRVAGCTLCEAPGGRVVFEGARLRVIHAVEAGFPAFYRVVWREHSSELTDLSADDRALCLQAVAEVEECLRNVVAPTKINLAALGNVVPHLHWHVIGRFDWDSHFPAPVWAGPQRERDMAREAALAASLPVAEQMMIERLRARSF